jgi:peptidoglycan/LPS O-acetylase OafA/YrhL
MVVLSHTQVHFFGFAPGIVAVICFFMISGYVMTLLIERHYRSPGRIGLFYLDRLARLYPQFLVYSAVSLILIKSSALPNYPAACGLREVGLNLLMFPLDIYQLIDLQCMLIPQAWSLGLELSFYAVIPLLLIFARPLVRWITCCSIVIFSLAYFGFINADTYGYRLLPGTLFIFLVGASIANENLFWRWQAVVIWLGALLFFTGLFFSPQLYAAPCTKEVVAGVLIGTPAIAVLKRLTFSKRDEVAGNLSYGVFLSHYIFVSIYAFAFDGKTFGISVSLAIIALSTLSSLATYHLIELRAIKWRRRFRNPEQAAKLDPGGNAPNLGVVAPMKSTAAA